MPYAKHIWLQLLADLLVNLSSGWFGAVLIVPNFIDQPFPYNIALLTGDFLMGIFTLGVAFYLRKEGNIYD